MLRLCEATCFEHVMNMFSLALNMDKHILNLLKLVFKHILGIIERLKKNSYQIYFPSLGDAFLSSE